MRTRREPTHTRTKYGGAHHSGGAVTSPVGHHWIAVSEAVADPDCGAQAASSEDHETGRSAGPAERVARLVLHPFGGSGHDGEGHADGVHNHRHG